MVENRIRPLEEADVPAVADLHRRMFKIAPALTDELLSSYRGYCRAVFFENPWREPSISRLVCEENGRITGFIGQLPRPLTFNGRPVLASVTSQFVVDPADRSMAGVRLLKACLDGPQDLTFADESTGLTRQLWERLGGATAFCHSMRWLAVLRPVQLSITTAPKLARWAGVARPLVRLADDLAARVPRSPFGRPKRTAFAGRPLQCEELREVLNGGRVAVTPAYTNESLRWVLDRIGSLKELHGPLRAIRVESPDGKTAGCYLYHRKPTGVSRVILFWAQPGRQDEVLSHLFEDAWSSGCGAIGGRVPPRLMEAFSRARCMMDDRQTWFLVHSREQRLVQAICAGDDNLSALDGEWMTYFNYKSPAG